MGGTGLLDTAGGTGLSVGGSARLSVGGSGLSATAGGTGLSVGGSARLSVGGTGSGGASDDLLKTEL